MELECAYCTDDAIGYDEDGELTCGDCMPLNRPLPQIIEVSGEDGENEENEESEEE